MEWSECISKAICYIEDNITEELTIGEYIKKRRLALAGSEIVTTDEKIIDI